MGLSRSSRRRTEAGYAVSQSAGLDLRYWLDFTWTTKANETMHWMAFGIAFELSTGTSTIQRGIGVILVSPLVCTYILLHLCYCCTMIRPLRTAVTL
jgi:hypothetical protein